MLRQLVLLRVGGAEGVGCQVLAELGDGAEDERIVEVDVLDALGVALEARDKAVEVGALQKGVRIRIKKKKIIIANK